MWLSTVPKDTMRSFLLFATVAFLAVQFTQVFCESSEASILEESPEVIAQLAKDNGVSEDVMEERFTVLAKIKQLPLWKYYNVIQQERFREAVIKNTPIPNGSYNVKSYQDIIDPKNADLFQSSVSKSVLRLLANIPISPLPSEQAIGRAISSPLWKTLKDCQKDLITRSILRDQNVPAGFNSWSEALSAPTTLSKWVADNKDGILSKKC